LPYTIVMIGREFIARVRKLGRKAGTEVRIETQRGKGSHRTLRYGRRLTIVKDPRKEIGTGLLRAMCRQLGIDPRDL